MSLRYGPTKVRSLIYPKPLKKSDDMARRSQLADDSAVSARVGIAGVRNEIGGAVAAGQGRSSATRHFVGAGFARFGLAFATSEECWASPASSPDVVCSFVAELLGLLATGPWL